MNAVATLPTTANLPTLVQAAADRLATATSAAEVLEAREMARLAQDAAAAALRIANMRKAREEVISACNHAKADALEIEYKAERRFADEYDEAQKKGLVATAESGRPKSVSEENALAKASDFGVTRKDVMEFREARDAEAADPGITRRTLDEELGLGQSPRRASLLKAFKEVTRGGSHVVSKRDRPELQDKDAKVADTIVRGCIAIANNLDILGLERIADALDTLDPKGGNITTIRNAHTALGKLLEVCDG